MHITRSCLLLVLAGYVLLFAQAQDTKQVKKLALNPQVVSSRVADADSPQFVRSTSCLYLFWTESKGKGIDLSIHAIHPDTKRFDPVGHTRGITTPGIPPALFAVDHTGRIRGITTPGIPPALFESFPPMIIMYAALAAETKREENPSTPPEFFLAYAGALAFVSNFPDYCFARLVWDQKGILSIVVDEEFIRRRPLSGSHRRRPFP
jgi:hypothetical protein